MTGRETTCSCDHDGDPPRSHDYLCHASQPGREHAYQTDGTTKAGGVVVSGQEELDVTPRARSTDPATSHAAAASVRRRTLTATHRAIGTLLATYGPQCDEELHERLLHWSLDDPNVPRVSPSGLRTRRRELVDAGLVVDSGRETRTRTGRRTVLWQLAR